MKKNLVLYADDDIDDRDIFSELFRDYSELELKTFEKGKTLVNYLMENLSRVCYIILDQNMPGQSGAETLMQIKRLIPGFAIPVTIYTTTIVEEDRLIFEKEGANYIQKPSTMSEIERRIREIAAACLKTLDA